MRRRPLREVGDDGVIGAMHADPVHRRLDALWRMESPRLLARLARITGNIDTAEELAQDVLLVRAGALAARRACRTTRRRG